MGTPIATRVLKTGYCMYYKAAMTDEMASNVVSAFQSAVLVDIQNVRDAWDSGVSLRNTDHVRSPWQTAVFECRESGAHVATLVNVTEFDDGSARHECIVVVQAPFEPDPVITGSCHFYTDATGRLVGSDRNIIVYPLVDGYKTWNAEEQENLRKDLIDTVSVVGGAIAFANCKNVELVEEEHLYPSRQMRRAAERRGEPKPPRFYTLRINPNATRKQGQAAGASSGRELSLHIVRGHFATYTEERPLFGKYSGTFWVPAHVRGSQEVGIVGKDYEIAGAAA